MICKERLKKFGLTQRSESSEKNLVAVFYHLANGYKRIEAYSFQGCIMAGQEEKAIGFNKGNSC